MVSLEAYQLYLRGVQGRMKYTEGRLREAIALEPTYAAVHEQTTAPLHHQGDRAIDLLEAAVEERAGGVYGIKGSFLFTALRGHPRFKALLRGMNLE